MSRCSVPLHFFVGPVLSTHRSSAVFQASAAFLIAGAVRKMKADIPRAHDLRMSACGLSLILNKVAAFSFLEGIIKKCFPFGSFFLQNI